MNTSQVELLEEFEFKNKTRNAFLVEGRIIWKFQTYLDFLAVNKEFYGNEEQDNAKRMFWLQRHEIHPQQAFRAKRAKGKVVYVNRQVQVSETPCKWEIKIYSQGFSHPFTFWKNFYDNDSARTIDEMLVKDIFGRIDPNGQIKQKYPEQNFTKALILDRETDQIVFQYPEQGFMLPDVETARKELHRVAKHFREKQCFPPQEHYSMSDLEEQEFKATPKIIKEDTNDYNHIFLQMKEALYSECARLNLTEYIVNVADLTFISFNQNYLAVAASPMQQKDKQETFLAVLNQFYKRFFGESVEVGYKKKEPIFQTETQPKIAETKTVEVEKSKAIKTPKVLKSKAYFKNPDKVFDDMMIEFFRTVSQNPIEFESLKLKFHDTDKMCVCFTLPSQELIEAFNYSKHSTYFRMHVRKYFDSSYQIRLRHEDIAASFIPSINKI